MKRTLFMTALLVSMTAQAQVYYDSWGNEKPVVVVEHVAQQPQVDTLTPAPLDLFRPATDAEIFTMPRVVPQPPQQVIIIHMTPEDYRRMSNE